MKTGHDLIAEAKTRITEIPVTDAQLAVAGGAVLLDCREPSEYAALRVPGSVFIPRGTLEGAVEAQVPRDRQVLVLCASGNRSALAADTLQQMGYRDVASVAGGIKAWYAAGGPVES
jgi:rhodanese-related sulfurtransferase